MHINIPSSIGLSFLALKYEMGGSFEKPGERGTSHLMEHLICKTFDDMNSEFDMYGIDYNAYTSNNCVVVYFSGLDEYIKKISQRVVDRVTKQKTLWTKKQFEIEKKIVLQEYGDSFNNPEYGFFLNSIRQHYNHCSPIGIKEEIINFSYKDSLSRAEEFKYPRLICEVGPSNIDFNKFSKDKEFNKYSFGEYNLPWESTIASQDKKIVMFMSNKTLPLNSYSKMNLLMDCLNEGLESPLVQEIREKRGLSYSSNSVPLDLGNDIAYFFYSTTTNDNVKELQKVYNKFFDKDFSDLVSKKRFKEIKSSILIEKKKSELLPHTGAVRTVLSKTNPYLNLEKISYKDIEKLYNNNFRINDFVTSVY